VLDVDTVKGCEHGMKAYPNGGCYGQCYAAKMARLYGFDFSVAVSRKQVDRGVIERVVKHHSLDWFRTGCMGDPSHDWDWTVEVCDWLGCFKIPVVVTKHWKPMSEDHVKALRSCGAVVNTSTSALDTEAERDYRVGQFYRMKDAGVSSVLRIVSCQFGLTCDLKAMNKIQEGLFYHRPHIDNPLRVPTTAGCVRDGSVLTQPFKDLGARVSISIASNHSYIGGCDECPDQCGAIMQRGET
jgi:hypothetical protein